MENNNYDCDNEAITNSVRKIRTFIFNVHFFASDDGTTSMGI